MRLFHNRPFAFLCFIFIFSALFVSCLSYKGRLTFAAIFLALSIIVGVILLSFRFLKKGNEKIKIKVLFLLLVAIFAALAPITRIAFVDTRQKAALSECGERYFSFVVLEEKYVGSYSSEYLVRTESIGGEAKRYKCTVVCAFGDSFNVGDKIYAKAEISELGEELLGYERARAAGQYLQAFIEGENDYKLLESEANDPYILLCKVKNSFTDYLEAIFGKDDAALAKGFLLGDTSTMERDVIRDLRRSGTVHLLAVSGLHMSVIIGSLDIILIKLFVGRKARSVILSLAALAFLALSGFSMSACRSVVMLWMVYVSFIYVKENDSLTSLFSAVALIMLLSPSSVNDVGLWLSFLATLGLISVWQPISIKLSSGNRAGVKGRLIYIAKRIFLSLLLTFICNAFICFVVWISFGEMSTVSIPSNLVLSPLSSLYMILVLLSAIFGFLPFVASLASFVGEGIVLIARFFSERSGAVISLTYDFVAPIIIVMTVAVAVMLVIRLRNRWLVFAPPLLAALAFFICFSVYTAARAEECSVVYHAKNNEEAFVLSNKYSSALVDISYGSYSFLYESLKTMEQEHTTEISEIVLTHYHARHAASLEKLLCRSLVRRLYLPIPRTQEGLKRAREIVEVCEELDVEIYVYENSEKLNVLGVAWCGVISGGDVDDLSHPAVVAVIGGKNKSLCYLSEGALESSVAAVAKETSSRCDKTIVGIHGRADEKENIYYRTVID